MAAAVLDKATPFEVNPRAHRLTAGTKITPAPIPVPMRAYLPSYFLSQFFTFWTPSAVFLPMYSTPVYDRSQIDEPVDFNVFPVEDAIYWILAIMSSFSSGTFTKPKSFTN